MVEECGRCKSLVRMLLVGALIMVLLVCYVFWQHGEVRRIASGEYMLVSRCEEMLNGGLIGDAVWDGAVIERNGSVGVNVTVDLQ